MYTHALTHRDKSVIQSVPVTLMFHMVKKRAEKNKHTALWLTAAWQPAKPRGPWCWSNIVMVGTTLFSVPMLPSDFIYCSVVYKHDGWGGGGQWIFFCLNCPWFDASYKKPDKQKYIDNLFTQHVTSSMELHIDYTMIQQRRKTSWRLILK